MDIFFLPPAWDDLCINNNIIMSYSFTFALFQLLRSDAGTSESGAIVTSTLRLLLLLEHLRPKMLRKVPTLAKLVRLMCIFLIGGYYVKNDTF